MADLEHIELRGPIVMAGTAGRLRTVAKADDGWHRIVKRFPDIRDTIRALEASAPGAEADAVADRLIAKLHAAAATIRATKADKAPTGIMAMEQYLSLVTAHMRAHDCDQASAEQAVRTTPRGLKLWNSWGDRQHNADVLAEDRTRAPQATAKTDTTNPEGSDNMSKRYSKEQAWAAIEAAGAHLLQKRERAGEQLTKAQAIADFMRTPAGIELVKWYRDPLGDLDDAAYHAHIAKRHRLAQITGTPAGAPERGTWSDVACTLAQDIAKRDGVPFTEALNRLRTEQPDVWDCFETERYSR